MFQSVTTASASSRFHAAVHGLVLTLLASILFGYAVRMVRLVVVPRPGDGRAEEKAPVPVRAPVPIASLHR